jgi:hypothetical protein
MAAASWGMAEAMPRWRISGLTNTAATHGEYCGRLHTVVLDNGAATHRNRSDKCNYCIRDLVLLRVGAQPGLTQLRRSHSADSTTDGRSSSQLLPGAAGTPRVVALGMSLPVALVSRTRIRRQIVVYFCRHTGSLSKKTARRQRDSGANRCQKNFRKKLYVV